MRLELQANGPFEYTTFRASESLYVLDMRGVSAGDRRGRARGAIGLDQELPRVDLFLRHDAHGRIEVLLEKGVEPRVERTDAQDVELVVSRNADAAAATPAKGTSQTASATSTPVIRTQEGAVVVPASSKLGEKKAGTNFESINQVNLAKTAIKPTSM